MMELTKELIENAKNCQTAEELIALAKENEIELSPEEAALLFQDFGEGEISDEELDNVAGGQEGCVKPANPYQDVYWKRPEDVQFIFNIGDQVESFALGCEHHTATCKVGNRKAEEIFKSTTTASGHPGPKISLGFSDKYYLEKMPGVKSVFINGWYQRHNIEK